MIFATDLDRTMIYSKRFLEKINSKDVTLVETLDGKEISYMSKQAIKKLELLIKEIQVIPVTTRSVKQFKRVKVFEQCEYAITSNGGIILHRGEILPEWEKVTQRLLESYEKSFKKIIQVLENQDFITKKPSLVDGKFVFTKTNNVQECKEFLELIIDPNIWNYTIQNQKVYVIPKKITKGFTLEYLCEKLLNDYEVIAAGDSLMDLDMLEYAKCAIIPRHGELNPMYTGKNQKTFVVGEGMNAANDILTIVLESIK